jgi:hypothetical protein
MSNQSGKYSAILNIAGILFIIWGILGMMDAKNYTYAGYGTNDDWSVNNVEAGSPAETAGLEVGDIIKSTGGIAVTDTKALNKRERAKVGETRDIVVDRNGEEVTLQLTYSGMTDQGKTNNMVGFIIGLLFVIIGLYSNFKHKSSLSSSFALFSICFGYLFLNGPYTGNGILSTIVSIVNTTIVLYAFTRLVIYMLKYPPESGFLTGKNNKIIYLPMLILLLIIIVLEITQMDNSSTLRMTMRLLFGAFIIGYFLIALITLLKKYMKASVHERSAKGLTMMLIGTVIGLVPILIYFTVSTLSPGTELPGNDYVFYTFAAIPIFFMLALNKVHTATVE